MSNKVDFSRLFRRLVEQHGDSPALINTERDRRYSFRELHALTSRIANTMRDDLSLGEGDRYLLILENDNLSLMHVWTILKGTASAVFTNFRDPLDEHLRIAEFVKPKCVFVEASMAARYAPPLQSLGAKVVALDKPDEALHGVLDFWSLVNAASDADPGIEFDRFAHTPLLRFTGGTTGAPKCAAYTYDNLAFITDSFNEIEDKIFSCATRMLHFAPLSHGSFLMLLPTFFAGGCNLTQNVPDVELWRSNVERHRATASFLVPTLLYRLAMLQQQSPRDLASLDAVLYGAAPMSPDKLVELRAAFGDIFVQGYASTEAPGAVSALPKRLHRSGSEAERRRLTSAGLPTTGVELKIVDSEGREAASGDAGEIWIRHRGVISGYWGNPGQTAKEFIDGWWVSGDIGRIDAEGLLYLVDRKKDMIISGGFNIYASEVETALTSHPAVLMAAVVGIPSLEWGEAVHAEVVLRPGASADDKSLIAHAKAAIGAIKAPKTIAFVDALPLSAVGKVLRRKVQDKYWKDSERRIG
jgi:acyl-CoA synthetase (AMP-forming)/AMP-acid ligase II